VTISLLRHEIDIYAGFTPFSRYRSRRALLYCGGHERDVG
jgi:hypothetical protein